MVAGFVWHFGELQSPPEWPEHALDCEGDACPYILADDGETEPTYCDCRCHAAQED